VEVLAGGAKPAGIRIDWLGPGALRLSGELDVAGVPEVLGVLDGADGDIELECSGLSFMDASGLGLFLIVHRACEHRGAKLVLVDPSEWVVRLVDLVGLRSVLLMRGDR
jgi:anti-anti-sigma factor